MIPRYKCSRNFNVSNSTTTFIISIFEHSLISNLFNLGAAVVKKTIACRLKFGLSLISSVSNDALLVLRRFPQDTIFWNNASIVRSVSFGQFFRIKVCKSDDAERTSSVLSSVMFTLCEICNVEICNFFANAENPGSPTREQHVRPT